MTEDVKLSPHVKGCWAIIQLLFWGYVSPICMKVHARRVGSQLRDLVLDLYYHAANLILKQPNLKSVSAGFISSIYFQIFFFKI